MQFPSDVYYVICLDIIDCFVQQIFDLSSDDKLNVAISQSLDSTCTNAGIVLHNDLVD